MQLLQQIKKNLNKLVFIIFFFANTTLLIAPVVWTNIFSIAYLTKVYNRGRYKLYFPLLAIGLIYFGLHYFLAEVEDWGSYIKTSLYLLFMFFNLIAATIFLEKNKSEQLISWMHQLNWLAFAVFVISLIFLLFNYPLISWQLHEFGFGDRESMHRYQGLIYEPSYYALMLSPLLIYFLLKFLTERQWKHLMHLLMILIPLAATFSFGLFGVLGVSFFLAIFIILIAHRFIPNFVWLPIGAFLIAFVVLMMGNSLLKERVVAIVKGEDTSVRGRTYEAYYLAYQMAEEKDKFVGMGPGQIKTVGERHIRPFYGYSKEEWPVLAIPNTMAETLAIYGISGVVLRLALLIFLFFKFSVYQNYFRLILFSFLFLYQFLGSFITSTGEYCLWIMTLYVNFESLDIKKPA